MIEERGIETFFKGSPALCAALSFLVRTGNTFLGSLLWVDYCHLLGLQVRKQEERALGRAGGRLGCAGRLLGMRTCGCGGGAGEVRRSVPEFEVLRVGGAHVVCVCAWPGLCVPLKWLFGRCRPCRRWRSTERERLDRAAPGPQPQALPPGGGGEGGGGAACGGRELRGEWSCAANGALRMVQLGLGSAGPRLSCCRADGIVKNCAMQRLACNQLIGYVEHRAPRV